MTVSQLYKSVAQLGFEDSLEGDERFIFAANRALLQVNAIRPATSSYIINHKPMDNMLADATFTPVEKKSDLIYNAENVKSYYFEAEGNGTLYIEKYNASNDTWQIINTVDFVSNKGFTAYRGFIKQDGNFISNVVRLRFVGDYIYHVKCVAMYSYLYSEDANDIPAYEAFTRYDISKLVTDFISLASPPIVEADGITHLNQGYDIENGRVILLPYEKKGLYKVIYNRLPKSIVYGDSPAEDDTDIDLDEDLCALLPVLVASYVWVDDEPEKAQYYLMLYKERAADIERRIFDATPVQIKSINGW